MAKFEFSHLHGAVACPTCGKGCFITLTSWEESQTTGIRDVDGCEHLQGVQILHKQRGDFAAMYVFE